MTSRRRRTCRLWRCRLSRVEVGAASSSSLTFARVVLGLVAVPAASFVDVRERERVAVDLARLGVAASSEASAGAESAASASAAAGGFFERPRPPRLLRRRAVAGPPSAPSTLCAPSPSEAATAGASSVESDRAASVPASGSASDAAVFAPSVPDGLVPVPDVRPRPPRPRPPRLRRRRAGEVVVPAPGESEGASASTIVAVDTRSVSPGWRSRSTSGWPSPPGSVPDPAVAVLVAGLALVERPLPPLPRPPRLRRRLAGVVAVPAVSPAGPSATLGVDPSSVFVPPSCRASSSVIRAPFDSVEEAGMPVGGGPRGFGSPRSSGPASERAAGVEQPARDRRGCPRCAGARRPGRPAPAALRCAREKPFSRRAARPRLAGITRGRRGPGPRLPHTSPGGPAATVAARPAGNLATG